MAKNLKDDILESRPFVDVKITSVLLFAQSKKLVKHAIFVMFERF